MKLISHKYILALILAIVVLATTVSYISYDVIIAQPVPKTPEQIIDSLRLELRFRDSIIQSLNKRVKDNTEIVDIPSPKDAQITSSVEPKSTKRNKEEQPRSILPKERLNTATNQPVFVGF